MLKIFNLKTKKENAKKKEIKRTEKVIPIVKLSRKESKALQAKAKLEFCGHDDDLGYC